MIYRSVFLTLAVLILPALPGVALAGIDDLPLRDNVGVAQITGGDATNHLWGTEVGNEDFRKILVRALDKAGLLERARGEGRYALTVVLERIDQPATGFSATAHVKYTLTDRSCGEQVFQETIAAENSMDMWDSMMRVGTSKKLCRDATRANTALVAERLQQVSLFREGVSLR